MIENEATARCIALAARHINASVREAIPDDVLLRGIRGETVGDRYRPHLKAFYDETDATILSDLVLSGAVGWPDLARGARDMLRPDHETRMWLDERAGFQVG